MIEDTKLGYQKYVLDEFEFENGEVLRNVEVEYTTCGTPKYDENGNIANAVVYCHRFNGNCLSIEELDQLIGPESVLSDYNFFYISITSLGYPESCSPSTTNLKSDFPQYSIKDRVNFKRKFLDELFNISKVLGVLGVGTGGYDTYTWACEYPDEMEFVIMVNSSFKTDGYRYITFKALDTLIKLSNDYLDKDNSEQLFKQIISIKSSISSQFLSEGAFENFTLEDLDKFMDISFDENSPEDIYDFKYMNTAVLNYDIEDKLSNIKAKTLIVSASEDVYFSPEFDAKHLEDKIENLEIHILDALEFILNDDYSIFASLFREFLEEFKD